jgi:hypothetical protein
MRCLSFYRSALPQDSRAAIGTSSSADLQATEVTTDGEAPEQLAVTTDAACAEARLPLADDTALQGSFKGLSASLGRALKNEPCLELKRARIEEAGDPAGTSNQDDGGNTASVELQVSRRRRLQSEGGAGPANDPPLNQEGSEVTGSERMQSAQEAFGFSPQAANRAEALVTSREPPRDSLLGEAPKVSGQQVPEQSTPDAPTPMQNASPSSPSPTNLAAVCANTSPGTLIGRQSQQRNNWGRRRPPGIDYVWDDEEFFIAAGGEKQSVVRHPLEGLRSAYATVRQPRVSLWVARCQSCRCSWLLLPWIRILAGEGKVRQLTPGSPYTLVPSHIRSV